MQWVHVSHGISSSVYNIILFSITQLISDSELSFMKWTTHFQATQLSRYFDWNPVQFRFAIMLLLMRLEESLKCRGGDLCKYWILSRPWGIYFCLGIFCQVACLMWSSDKCTWANGLLSLHLIGRKTVLPHPMIRGHIIKTVAPFLAHRPFLSWELPLSFYFFGHTSQHAELPRSGIESMPHAMEE